ncbi:MAG: STAS domain-containing protein [Actinomycetota bacterium]|nr:STAS domain-containing protein [Actinomycetota bacterium]
MTEFFDVRSGKVNGALVITVSGEVDVAGETQFVRQVVDGVGTTDAQRVVLDLSRVAFMDSTGLRMLLLCKRRAEERRIPLTLSITADGPVSRLIDVSGVAEMFQLERMG